ncbi:MAG: hypothetical protein O3B95_05130 [Chloroflexi bacterium]|nr:hypothetical protein [Chloroflexota bacterium]
MITDNPNALLSVDGTESLRNAFAASGEAGVALGEQVFAAIRESLASAIGDVFFLAFLFVVAGIVATAFIREVPLRKRGAPITGAPADGPSAAGTTATGLSGGPPNANKPSITPAHH